ncbi:hypothetical protein FAUST_2095 [Fusarium austroamericanum]|uniref:Azaphilone pigments biosynthesis cluster protein L N-terminal domain-containing protein n=1 Tax=Fusarium austroamericanum TaxID=282268 RepID=A0AAN6C7R5_FUSAU|nr:hypothetical protein FAUST_2095 [Fusarium austroamericanum]
MEPISLTASVIAVATLAWNSGNELYSLVKTYNHANEIFQELSSDIHGLNSVLASLQSIGGEKKGASFSHTQCLCLKEVQPAIDYCLQAYEAFRVKVANLMCNSTSEHISKRDRLTLHFKSNDIVAFRIQLSSYKSTLTIALLVTSITSSSGNNRELISKIEFTTSLLAGQMEGIELAMQAIEDAGARSQSLVVGMTQTMKAISQCGDVCRAATAVAGPVDGAAIYKLVRATDNARFMMGSTNTQAIAGGPRREYGEVVGQNHARVWLADSDPNTALTFMTGP